MQEIKLDLKVGTHEFHAEGREEFVKAQFEDWKRLISVPEEVGAAGGRVAVSAGGVAEVAAPGVSRAGTAQAEPETLDRILRSDERTVSVRFLPQTAERYATSWF